MKKVCSVLAIVLLIGGIIGAIVVTNQLGIASAIGVYISALILPVILFALSEILERLEQLEGLSDEIEKYSAGLKDLTKDAEEKEILKSGGWKCPVCDTINRFYVTSCKCGQQKPPFND